GSGRRRRPGPPVRAGRGRRRTRRPYRGGFGGVHPPADARRSGPPGHPGGRNAPPEVDLLLAQAPDRDGSSARRRRRMRAHRHRRHDIRFPQSWDCFSSFFTSVATTSVTERPPPPSRKKRRTRCPRTRTSSPFTRRSQPFRATLSHAETGRGRTRLPDSGTDRRNRATKSPDGISLTSGASESLPARITTFTATMAPPFQVAP